MKKIISLGGLFVVLNLPFGCNPCGPFDNRPYKIVSMSPFVGSVIESAFTDDLSTEFEIAAIRIMIDETERVGINSPVNLWVTNGAYACSPPDPNVQRLISINIISGGNISFGGIEYPAEGSINSLFKILTFDGAMPVEEFNGSPNSQGFNFAFGHDAILFQFIAKPDIPVSQKIAFTFTFDDGLEYQVLTPVFEVD
ncbi:MAG: hypothetical protein L3J29_06000 [Cyclobacteriaceae bacterium]|nr:hypothetical protein [Cyclobacteriaceae bacterium]